MRFSFIPLLLWVALLGLASGTPAKNLRHSTLAKEEGHRHLGGGCGTPSQRRRNPKCKQSDDQKVSLPTTTISTPVSESSSDSESRSLSRSRSSRSSRSQQASNGNPKRKRGPSKEFDYQQHDAIDFTDKRDSKRLGRKRGFGANNHKLNPRNDDSGIVHNQDPNYKPKPSGLTAKLRAAKNKRDKERKRRQKRQREDNRQRDSYNWDNDSDESNDQMYQRYHQNSKQRSVSRSRTATHTNPDATAQNSDDLSADQRKAKREKEDREREEMERKAKAKAVHDEAQRVIKKAFDQKLPDLIKTSTQDIINSPQMKRQISDSISDMKDTLAKLLKNKMGSSGSLDGVYKGNNPVLDWENEPSIDFGWKPMNNNDLFGPSEDMLRDFTKEAPAQSSGLGAKLGNYKLNKDKPSDDATTDADDTGDAGSSDSVDLEAEMRMYQQQQAQDQDTGDASPDSVDYEAEIAMLQAQQAQETENAGQVSGSTGL